MKAQDIFDKVVKHLAQQKHQAADAMGQCLYLTEDGSRCAVGCLIPDYHPALLSRFDAASVFNTWPNLAQYLGDDVLLLVKLQKAHDRSRSPDELRTELMNIADDFILDGSLIDTITEWKATRA